MYFRFLAAALLFVLPADAAEPRVDAYGDPLPPGAVARLGTMRFRHSDEIVACGFSPDGTQVVSASHSDGVRLWDRATGRLLKACSMWDAVGGGLGFPFNPHAELA